MRTKQPNNLTATVTNKTQSRSRSRRNNHYGSINTRSDSKYQIIIISVVCEGLRLQPALPGYWLAWLTETVEKRSWIASASQSRRSRRPAASRWIITSSWKHANNNKNTRYLVFILRLSTPIIWLHSRHFRCFFPAFTF